MKLLSTFKAKIFVCCLGLFCALAHPATAIGFADVHTKQAVIIEGLYMNHGTAQQGAFRKFINRHSSVAQKQPPAFREMSFFRRWVHKKMLRLLPGVMDKADKEAMWALGLGIGGLLIFPLLGPAALYLGISALEDGTTKRTEATVGIVLGAIATLYLVLVTIFILSFIGWF